MRIYFKSCELYMKKEFRTVVHTELSTIFLFAIIIFWTWYSNFWDLWS